MGESTYGAFAAGRNFWPIIVTKNFKLTLLYELIYGAYGMHHQNIMPLWEPILYAIL
jgi:hypothetical protein